MNRGRRTVTFVLCFGMLATFAACGSGATPAGFPTMPAESASAAPTGSPADTASASPLESPSEVPSESPSGSPVPTKSGRPAGTPAVTPDKRPGAVCSGSSENVPFWTQAASWLPFDVYCAVLPKGWFLSAATYDSHNGGILNAAYAGPGGASLQLKEGKFCTTSAAACSPHDAQLGPAAFGDRAGTLYSLAGGGFAIYVAPGTVTAWQAVGTKMTRDTFVALAAALAKVRKS